MEQKTVKCTKCRGVGQIMGLGAFYIECPDCEGKGMQSVVKLSESIRPSDLGESSNTSSIAHGQINTSYSSGTSHEAIGEVLAAAEKDYEETHQYNVDPPQRRRGRPRKNSKE